MEATTVYRIRHFGAPWWESCPTVLSEGPDVADLDEARVLAETTLRPGHVLRAYDDEGVVAHYEMDQTGVVVEVFRLD